MVKVEIDASKVVGKIKPMHAVNNGPLIGKKTQKMDNFKAFKEARIPFSRNHDASLYAGYGGEHVVDVHAIFPDFDADPYNPESYDFVLSDIYHKNILDAGTQVFYRLGSKIEHCIKKYGTLVPKDFQKWAVVCEHIIRHYNEGWADGYNWNIKYWEIWNEPNLDADDAANKRNWSGTGQQFYEFYDVTSRYLKKCFPDLKIGGIGSALTGTTYGWLDEFFAYLTRGQEPAPMDFFSWHIYLVEPSQMTEHSLKMRGLLDKYGYTDTESILDEWNYVESWGDGFTDSIKTIIGPKGAACTTATMCEAQNGNLDMLMYYDVRPSVYNGLFDFYTLEKLPGYYSFYTFASLYEKQQQVSAKSDDDMVYTLAATQGDTTSAIVCYYTNQRGTEDKTVSIDYKNLSDKKLYYILVDENHLFTEIFPENNSVTLKPNSVLFITQDDMKEYLENNKPEETIAVDKNVLENI